MKIKPVIVAGMSRAGTTFLYHNLQKHPNIFVPSRKEIAYFAQNYDQGLDWYHDFYKNCKRNQISLDICGIYFSQNDSIKRILDYNSDTKIILGIREPKEWIFSLYEQYKGSYKMPPFSEAINNGFTIKREGKLVDFNFNNNMIMKRIKEYQKYFGKNLLIFDFSLLKDSSLSVLKAIEKFIDAPSFFNETNFTNKKINARERKSSALFEKILQMKGIPELIIKLVPRNLLLKIRHSYYAWGAPAKTQNKTETLERYSKDEIALVNNIFEKDSKFVANLFQKNHIIDGFNKPLS